MGYSITWAVGARGCGRGKAALNMQQCKLGCQDRGGGGRGGGGGLIHSHLLPTLFQTVSSPGAMAACLVLTFTHSLQSDIFSWPFLCCLSSFALVSLAHQSPRSSWEPVSSWQAASAAAATVLSPHQLVLTQALTHSNPRTNEQTGAQSCTSARMSVLPGRTICFSVVRKNKPENASASHTCRKYAFSFMMLSGHKWSDTGLW